MQSNIQLKCCHKFCIAHYDYAHSLALGHGIILQGMTISAPKTSINLTPQFLKLRTASYSRCRPIDANVGEEVPRSVCGPVGQEIHDPQPAAQFVTPCCNERVRRSVELSRHNHRLRGRNGFVTGERVG